MNTKVEFLNKTINGAVKFINQFTAESFNLCVIVLLHCATMPTLLSLLTSISDRVPAVDIFLFLYTGLIVFLIRSIVFKETLSVVVNSLGFFCQAIILSLIVFK